MLWARCVWLLYSTFALYLCSVHTCSANNAKPRHFQSKYWLFTDQSIDLSALQIKSMIETNLKTPELVQDTAS